MFSYVPSSGLQVDKFKSKQAYPSYLPSKPAKQNSFSFHVISLQNPTKLGDAEVSKKDSYASDKKTYKFKVRYYYPLVDMTLGHGNPGHSAAPVQGAGPGLCCIASSYSAQAGCRLDDSGWPGGQWAAGLLNR
ncbi:hypothetical protein GE21DRAFT_2082 [Neurospora crassa]|uniref:Uncharacterized protein n=1 Tax=Neurospora crassa (strain ATCC 24698 / 74-OR23-1A / CBS 708.71 / DSM 1257 / FGSC 987) TaxID=367110 RepID=Q7SI07_NEUCR|nr:hypothetical protein NCU00645 [Neurospora crassa OR74A]EAA36549.1 hypothetical protein NCU00645 [Neurospora crassa OR74A]KHE89820.1 hypothetical protein GE21DRAFT_2082 [Neurospora crassa]|eukprot:XP_965785.1 hypothetical protein NCU00645 [Neurospora crassa OR74A]